LLIDTIALRRDVILVDNTGVGLSSGAVPRTVTEMARDAIAFIDALGVGQIDLLGYSLGGMVAQEFALLRPRWWPPAPTTPYPVLCEGRSATRLGRS